MSERALLALGANNSKFGIQWRHSFRLFNALGALHTQLMIADESDGSFSPLVATTAIQTH